jgi:transglutaminase-like putative cysteine protease
MVGVKFSFGCELRYDVTAPTVFVFCIKAAHLPSHRGLRESLVVHPDLPRTSDTASPLNNRYTRMTAPPGRLTLEYGGTVELAPVRADPSEIGEIPVADLPLDLFAYLQPSRFCEADRLARFAEEQFGAMMPGFSRVTAICNWIADNIAYRRGASDAQTSAVQTLKARAGVCRDFAHLGIACCRALGIPARFVSCYAFGLEPDDFHAVFEAYLGGQWWLFDPTRQALDGLVRIGLGRDAAEVSFASIYGAAESAGVSVHISAADPAAEASARTTEAIRSE